MAFRLPRQFRVTSSDNNPRCPRCGRELPSPSDACPACAEAAGAPRVAVAPPASGLLFTSRLPRVTIVFIALNVLVFLAMLARGVPLMNPTTPQLVRWGANYGPLTLGG